MPITLQDVQKIHAHRSASVKEIRLDDADAMSIRKSAMGISSSTQHGFDADFDPFEEQRARAVRLQKFIRIKDNVFRYTKLILPHVGLVLLLVVYTIVGAGLFHIVELPNEVATRTAWLKNYWQSRDNFLMKLRRECYDESIDLEQWKESGTKSLGKMEGALYTAYNARIIIAEDIQNISRTIWTFPKSVFFAATVITTIGYGHMVPHTTQGRVLCIVFGLFGIPLLLITIADIGKFLSDLISMIYQKYMKFKLDVKLKSRRIQAARRRRLAALDEDADHKDDDDDDDDENDIDDIRIPVWMVLIFLACYTSLGGLLFQYVEEWPYFDAFYFCFITMATIGFGDLVPAREGVNMMSTLLYIIIGLSITTMFIDLAGTEFIRKIHYFGTKIDAAKDAVEGAMASGLHAGENLIHQVTELKQLMALKRHGYDIPLPPHLLELANDITIGESFDLEKMYELYKSGRALNNILWEPVSPQVKRYLKPNIKILPNEITEDDAYVLENKVFERPVFGPNGLFTRAQCEARSNNVVTEQRSTWPRKDKVTAIEIAPFLVKETNV